MKLLRTLIIALSACALPLFAYADVLPTANPAYGDTNTFGLPGQLDITCDDSTWNPPTGSYEIYMVGDGFDITQGTPLLGASCGAAHAQFQNTVSFMSNGPAWVQAGDYKFMVVDPNDPGYIGEPDFSDGIGTHGVVYTTGVQVLSNDPAPVPPPLNPAIQLPDPTTVFNGIATPSQAVFATLFIVPLAVAGMLIGGTLLFYFINGLKGGTRRAVGGGREVTYRDSFSGPISYRFTKKRGTTYRRYKK